MRGEGQRNKKRRKRDVRTSERGEIDERDKRAKRGESREVAEGVGQLVGEGIRRSSHVVFGPGYT